tara:strand:- start:165 stop:578 length:414 start_codon:yes stop_codon:yes gene_type:complete
MIVYTNKMKEHFMPSNTITAEHIKEFGLKTSDTQVRILREQMSEENVQVVIFDTGFLLYKKENDDVIISSYYRSKDSTKEIEGIWHDLIDVFRLNNIKTIYSRTFSEKLKDWYVERYGFEFVDYDEENSRYNIKLTI